MPSIALCVSCYLAYLAGSLERKQASWANQWLLSQLSVSQLCFIPLSLRVVSHEIMTQDADDSRRCLRHTRSIKLIVCGQRSATDNGEIHRARLLYHSRSSLSLGTFGRTEKIWQAGPDMIQHILNESIHLPAPFVVGRLHPDHQISINNATLLIIEGGHFDTYQVIFRNPFSLFTTPPPTPLSSNMYRSTISRVGRQQVNTQLAALSRASATRSFHRQSPLFSQQPTLAENKIDFPTPDLPLGASAGSPSLEAPVAVTETALSRTPISQLLRTYLVYTICSYPSIVDYSPTLLSALTKSKIPGVAAITEFIVRRTFFSQFVGGETTSECTVVMEQLRKEGIGSMLVYSVEVDEDHAPSGATQKEIMEAEGEAKVAETLRCLERAGQFEREMQEKYGGEAGGTYIAIKIVSLQVAF